MNILNTIAKIVFCIAMLLLIVLLWQIYMNLKNVEKQLARPVKTETLFLPSPQKNCPIAYEGICYPVTKITAISCGEIAGHEGTTECQVMFFSEAEKPKIEVKK